MEKIKDELVFPEFQFTTIESGPLHTKQCSLSVMKKEADQHTDGWNEGPTATCGLILQGTEKNKDVPLPPGEALYVAVPAHLILSHEQCEQLVVEQNAKSIEKVREEVNSQISKYRYVLRLPTQTIHSHGNNADKCDLTQVPMIAYRHWVRRVEMSTHNPKNPGTGVAPDKRCPAAKCYEENVSKCPHSSTNDIAVIPVEPSVACSFRYQINQDPQGYLPVRFSEILSQTYVEEEVSDENEIYAGEYRCKLVPQYESPDAEDAERVYAHHCAFVMEDNRYYLIFI